MQSAIILADAHVHFYQGFHLGLFLDQALKNFQLQGFRSFAGFLFLTEIKADGWFQNYLRELSGLKGEEKPFGAWSFHSTKEDYSLIAQSSPEEKLFIIAGRQIKSAENLEVLALGTLESFEEGRPVETLIGQINQAGALPVLPWGVGKWFGRRGNLVNKLVDKAEIRPLFLGDSGNRPVFWPRPTLFSKAEEKGMAVLPGSDPLPFPTEINKVGRIGFKIEGVIDQEYPGRDIKKILLDPNKKPQTYGFLETPFRFFRNQLRMNLPAGKVLRHPGD